MMFFKRPQFSRGLTILESLVVLCTSLLLIITLVPVILVQMGVYKLPEPEITPKSILINGKDAVGQNKPQSALEPTPAPTSSPASATPPPPAKALPSSPPPVTSQSDKPPVPPMLEPASTSASTKP